MNRIRRLWSDGQQVVNGWLAIPSGFAAELMSHAGYDSLTIDLQHGVQDYASMIACLQAIGPMPALVRVPWNEPALVGKALDAGAVGVICPMVNTAEQAAAFVSHLRYPPLGQRSNGPIRAALRTPGYQAGANADVLAIPMIETAEAVANLDAILAVPGVDAIYLGPSDLSISMGGPAALDHEDAAMLALYDRIITAAQRAGVKTGVHCIAPAYAARMRARGFDLVTVDSDAGLLLKAARAALEVARE